MPQDVPPEPAAPYGRAVGTGAPPAAAPAGAPAPPARRTRIAAPPLTVLYAVRSATTLNRLLDVVPAFAGDPRVTPVFTIVPGSDFGADALDTLDGAGAHVVPWAEAVRRGASLVLAASPNGPLHEVDAPLVLLPHGAGYNKRLPEDGEGPADVSGPASGLHPRQLVRGRTPLATVHALAHPEQAGRLAAHVPPSAAERAVVVGDPTYDRMRESVPLRERYRAALGTGSRRLVVLVSTWGPESLLAREPGLAAQLTEGLPHDEYQVGLVLHPNEHSRLGGFTLRQHLAPALAAGLVTARPHQEWAALLVAADCVVTDHSSTALYFAALPPAPGGRRLLLGCYEGGTELIGGTPMDGLLSAVPALRPGARRTAAEQVTAVFADGAAYPDGVAATAAGAFAEPGSALRRLREHCYALLGLDPPEGPVRAEPWPLPTTKARRPAAFAVRTDVRGDTVYVARHPVAAGAYDGHVSAEEGAASLSELETAALIHRTARPPSCGPAWTVDEWSARVLALYPGCRSAAVVLPDGTAALRRRGGGAPLLVRTSQPPGPAAPRGVPAPAAVLSAVHARLEAGPHPTELICAVGPHRALVRLSEAPPEVTDTTF
ncbi:translation initiation factor 2 [Streptomyces sp. NPDC047002]|uniref:translation initiation factor 2 n=1 Tax=Streptomyces sp. NPDC047002 TaxID=3155475 RepID=UPI003454BCCE